MCVCVCVCVCVCECMYIHTHIGYISRMSPLNSRGLCCFADMSVVFSVCLGVDGAETQISSIISDKALQPLIEYA